MQNRILAYSNHFLVLALFILLLSPVNSYGLFGKPQFKNDIDSLQSLVQQCPTDTAKFKVLYSYFWTYANYDFNRAINVGNWAFEIIKNSKNLREQSDGLDIKGFILQKDDKYDSAYLVYSEALKISQKIDYPFREAWSYFYMGSIDELLGNYKTALYNMQKANHLFGTLKIIEQAESAKDHIKNIFERQGIYDSVFYYYNQKLEKAIKEKEQKTVTRIYYEMALSYWGQKNTKKAVEYFNKALTLAESIGDNTGIGYIYSSIGDLFIEQKKYYNIAIEYYTKGLQSYKSDFHQADYYSRLGNLYFELGNDSIALDYNLKSLKLSKAMSARHLTSSVYRNLGFIYMKKGNNQLALSSFSSCFEIGCPNCPKINFHDALIEIADLHLKLNNREKAFQYYTQALQLAQRFHARKEMGISYLKIGNYHQNNNSLIAATNYISALKAAQEIQDISLIRTIADTLCHYYKNTSNYKNAWQYEHLARRMEDSLSKMDKETYLADLAMKFEFDKLRSENEAKQSLSKAEVKKQKVYRNSFIVISVLLVILGFVVYASYRRKKNDNFLLTFQKEKIEEINQEILAQVEEIKSQKHEIERISGKLHETDQMKLRFFSNISHEIRTPLTLIINPLKNFIASFNGSADQMRQLDVIHNNASRLNELTNQILDLQKLDGGNLRLNLENADIVSHLKGVVSSFEGFGTKSGCMLSFKSQYNSVTCQFDKDKLTKILSNLLSNAFKYNKENGEVEVELKIENNHLAISVKDNGLGIPQEHINDVFKRYYQLENSNKQYEGTGIGLAYVKELVELMKGRVQVESELNMGTTVSVLIPISVYDVSDSNCFTTTLNPNNQVIAIKNEFPANDNEDARSVLIVEDNDDLRDFISDIFNNDFQIVTAKNGQEGLDVALRYLPDIIVSDVMMPLMNGLDMCSKLKQHEQTSHIPILLLTAKDSSESHMSGYQSGADDYIVKPFDSALLKLKVGNILSTRDAARKKFNFPIDTLKFPDIDKQFLQKCTDFVQSNIDIPTFSVEQLANHMAFSQRNFYRKIKALTNLTPSEYIRNFKMNYALQLLKDKKLKVYEVAMAIGYEDATSFSSVFKKQFGTTPSEFIA